MSGPNPWRISRRAFCASPLLLAVEAQAATPTLAQDVQRYVDFGIHRAGTRGERRTAQWLRARLTGLGYRTRIDPFAIDTLLDPEASVTSGGRAFAAFPQWNAPTASLNRPITGPLLPLAADTAAPAIRIVTRPAPLLANWDKPLDDLVSEAVRKQATALILAINDPSDDLFVCNQHHREALPIPVLLVARRDLAALASAAERDGAAASLSIRGKAVATRALNVVGFRPGRGRTLVVSTPLTGWFHCGAERGPGVALWLRMAERLSRQSRPVLMLGTGSHEIGHRGMEHALAQPGIPKPDEVALWLHFGASLAATQLDRRYGFTAQQFLVGTELTGDQAKAALGELMPRFVPGSAATLGEAGQVVGAGHRQFVGLSGQFPTFHTPLDRGEAVDFERLARIALAAEALARGFAEK
jgi:hypothetical protein